MHVFSLLGFIAVTFVAVATPGPDVILAMTNGYRVGFRRALPGFVAVILSDLLMIGAVAAGLGAMLLASAFWFAVLKYIGAFYLLYLGARMLLTTDSLADVIQAPPTSAAQRIVWRSFLVAITNPKAYLFFAALLPQFVDTTSAVWPQYVAFAVTFIFVELAIMSAYAWAGEKLGVTFSRKWMTRFERTCGISLLAAAISLLLFKRSVAHTRIL